MNQEKKGRAIALLPIGIIAVIFMGPVLSSGLLYHACDSQFPHCTDCGLCQNKTAVF